MSCYEWQAGTIKIPTKQFSGLYRAFIKGYNDIQLRKLRNLKALYDHIMLAAKHKRNFNYYEQMEAVADRYNVSFSNIEMLFPEHRKRPLHPTKKMFDFANTKTMAINVDNSCACISFNRADHSVYWSVYENNHACETAHNTPEAKLLFSLLQNVNYTRGSGGQIIGNDEYNRDNIEAGAGANYVVFSFGKNS